MLAYDSTSPGDIPAHAEVVLYYYDGAYAWTGFDLARFPNALKGAITVTGKLGIQIIDCEPGAVWPPTAAATLAKQNYNNGVRNTIYANASTWPAVDDALSAWGLERGRDIDGWIADYDGVAVVPAGFCAKQYATRTSPPLYDTSVTNGIWPTKGPPPEPPEGDENVDIIVRNDANGTPIMLDAVGVVNNVPYHWWQPLSGPEAGKWNVERLPVP